MSLFRLDSSIRTEGSVSREIADIVEAEWQSSHPDGTVLRRDVGQDPIAATVWANAVSASWTPAENRTPEQEAAAAQAARAVDPLIEADVLLFAVPLYNFGVSQHFKSWVDLVFQDPRMAAGTEPILAGKRAVLVVVRGGGYGAGTPREGWDHSTAWIRRILQDVWKLDLRVVESEFTLAGIAPAMAAFIDQAKESRVTAEQHARDHGRALAEANA
jgi:FMN-dependent NADH-azoreductase